METHILNHIGEKMENAKHGTYLLDNFQFQNGETLENVEVSYSTFGIPKYDDEGKITNLIMLSHSLEESYEPFWGREIILNETFPFDTNEYFFIIIIPLGIPESCSPSKSQLNNHFPKYTFEDRVNFKRQFLNEKFSYNKIHAILANGVGGYESLVWASRYPDDVNFLVLLSVTSKLRGQNYIFAKCLNDIIESNEKFYDGLYDESLIKMMVTLFKLVYIYVIPKKLLDEMSNEEIDIYLHDFEENSLFRDIYDFYYVNKMLIDYDIEDELSNIKAKTCIVGENDNSYLNFEQDILPLQDLIEDSIVVSVDLERNFNELGDISPIVEVLRDFLTNS